MLHATFRIWPSYLASLVFHPLRKLLYLALSGICWICIFWAFILKLSYKKVTPTKILIIWLKENLILRILSRRTWLYWSSRGGPGTSISFETGGGVPTSSPTFFSVRGEGKATLKYLLKLLVFKLEGGNCNHYFLQVMLEKNLKRCWFTTHYMHTNLNCCS